MVPGMPIITIRPRGLVISNEAVIDPAFPTASIVTSAPPDNEFPIMRHPVTLRTARLSSLGSTTRSAPSSLAKVFCKGYLAAAIIVPALVKERTAPIAHKPMVPAP